MAVHAGPGTTPSGGYGTYEDDRGQGWVILAGVLLLTLGVFNMIDGIAAISSAHWFVNGTRYVFGDLNAWGWVALCLGVLQLLVGLGVFARNQASRWTGIALLSVSAIAELLYMPSYPFWSLCLFAINILAIYGLAAYGRRIAE
jgi:hypothetical protein